MIPARYIGSQVYTADTMTYYSTLYLWCFTLASRLHFPFHNSSLLFKPSCTPSYFSSFWIELRTSPLLIPIVSLQVLLCSIQPLTLINSSAIILNTILKKYTKSQRHMYNSDLFLQPPTGSVFNTNQEEDALNTQRGGHRHLIFQLTWSQVRNLTWVTQTLLKNLKHGQHMMRVLI